MAPGRPGMPRYGVRPWGVTTAVGVLAIDGGVRAFRIATIGRLAGAGCGRCAAPVGGVAPVAPVGGVVPVGGVGGALRVRSAN